MQAHFIDVGQGDCIYIAAGGQNMLIDCGEADESVRVVSYLRDMGVKRLDYVIGTHPHSDHMGGMDRIIGAFEIGEFIIPHLDDEDIPTTSYFLRFLDAAEEHRVKLTEAVTGSEFTVGDAHCEIVAPNSKKYEDINNYSVGLVLRHGSESFIFTGDAEGVAEQEMLDGGRLGKMSVYKVGHHGSSTSSDTSRSGGHIMRSGQRLRPPDRRGDEAPLGLHRQHLPHGPVRKHSYHVGRQQSARRGGKEQQMTIDRFEGDYAVLETEEGMVNIHRAHLPSSAREGDVVTYSNGGYTVDREATDDLRAEVRSRLHKLLTGEDD